MRKKTNIYIEFTLGYIMKQTLQDTVKAVNQYPEREPLRLFTALNASQLVFSDEENYIQFKVKGDKGINKVKVIYDEGADLFNVEFWSIRGVKTKLKGSIIGLGWENITQVIWKAVVIV